MMEISKDNTQSLTNDSTTTTKIPGLSFPSGSKLKVGYLNEKKEGEGIVTSPVNIKLATLHYHNDVLQGLCIFYNEKGEMTCLFVYENGIQNGWAKEYKDGKPIYTGIYKNGEMISELHPYKGKSDYFEEIKDNKRIAIRKYIGDDYLEGISYCYENEVLTQVFYFKCGEKDRKLFEFKNRIMIEYDENDMVVYIGNYEGDIMNGFKRQGKGEIHNYKNGMISEVLVMYNDVRIGYKEIEGDIMKEYESEQLVYQGGWCKDDYIIVRNGEGFVYSSSDSYYKCIYNKGRELQKILSINDKEMTLYDTNRNVIYKGEYDSNYGMKGKGLQYEYTNGVLKSVNICENGESIQRWLEISNTRMIEVDENGLLVYDGEYCKNDKDDIVRDREGYLYDKGNVLIYSGNWKNNKKEGKGKYYVNGSLIYEGEWKNDNPNGKGTYFNNNGEIIHEGEWKNGYFDLGNERWLSYKDGKICSLYENGKIKYEGEWKDNLPNGRGIWFAKDGNMKYEGNWKDGMLEIGNRIWFEYKSNETIMKSFNDCIIYRGSIKSGLADGYGKLISDNKVINEGEWKQGVLVVNHSKSIEIMNGRVFDITVQRGGLFGCRKIVDRNERSELYINPLMNELNETPVVDLSPVDTDDSYSYSYSYSPSSYSYSYSSDSSSIESDMHEESLNIQAFLYILNNYEKRSNLKEMIIEKGTGNDIHNDIRICDFDVLERIIIKTNSLKYLQSLTISNNPELEHIKTEDGGWNEKKSRITGVCYFVKRVKISSFLFDYLLYE